MTDVRLVWHQFRFDLRIFVRDPAAMGFTVALPLIFLVLFVSIFGNRDVVVDDHSVQGSTYYLPGIVTLGLVSATYVNLAIAITGLRERNALKRVRSTPMPAWAYIAGKIGTSIVVTLALAVLLVSLGGVLYGIEVSLARVPAVLTALVVGAAAFCALGFALAATIPSEGAAPPIANAVILPLYFISGVFVPSEQLPDGLLDVAGVLPVKPLFDAFLAAFDPVGAGSGFSPADLGIVAAWGVGGLIIAVLTFRWTPRSG